MKPKVSFAARGIINKGKLEKSVDMVRTCWLEGLDAEMTTKITKLSINDVTDYFNRFEKEKNNS